MRRLIIITLLLITYTMVSIAQVNDSITNKVITHRELYTTTGTTRLDSISIEQNGFLIVTVQRKVTLINFKAKIGGRLKIDPYREKVIKYKHIKGNVNKRFL